MRTTLQLNDDLMREAKVLAAESGTSLTSLIEDGLRLILFRRGDKSRPAEIKITTFGGDGPRAGVDIDDSAGLLEWMEENR